MLMSQSNPTKRSEKKLLQIVKKAFSSDEIACRFLGLKRNEPRRKRMFTYRATFKIARLDGADIRDVTTGETVRAYEACEVECIAHINFMDKTLPVAFPGYRVLTLPTEANGDLVVRKASDAGLS